MFTYVLASLGAACLISSAFEIGDKILIHVLREALAKEDKKNEDYVEVVDLKN